MKCEQVRDLLDQVVFDPQTELHNDVNAHLEECKECSDYRDSLAKQHRYIQMLSHTKPQLYKSEELTNDILLAIKDEEKKSLSIPTAIKRVKVKLFNHAVRWLAAASVLLALTFGFEQYHVLEKLQTLEEANQQKPEIQTGLHFRMDPTDLPIAEFKELFDQSGNGSLNTKSVIALLSRSELTLKDLKNYPQYHKMFKRDLEYLLQFSDQLIESS